MDNCYCFAMVCPTFPKAHLYILVFWRCSVICRIFLVSARSRTLSTTSQWCHPWERKIKSNQVWPSACFTRSCLLVTTASNKKMQTGLRLAWTCLSFPKEGVSWKDLILSRKARGGGCPRFVGKWKHVPPKAKCFFFFCLWARPPPEISGNQHPPSWCKKVGAPGAFGGRAWRKIFVDDNVCRE